MIKKTLLAFGLLVVALIGLGAVMYVRNAPPTLPPLPDSEAARVDKPYVVKLHAQWCPKCMVTKDVWNDVVDAYAGRVNLLVLDFTNEANTARSRAEAARLGLQAFYEEFGGVTGTIVVLDAATREVAASISGSRDFSEYRAAIDAALARAAARGRDNGLSESRRYLPARYDYASVRDSTLPGTTCSPAVDRTARDLSVTGCELSRVHGRRYCRGHRRAGDAGRVGPPMGYAWARMAITHTHSIQKGTS